LSDEAVRLAVPGTVADGDQARFLALLLDEFKHLHENNAIRFGIRPLAFAAWKRQVDDAR
jgi:hypothetical protein